MAPATGRPRWEMPICGGRVGGAGAGQMLVKTKRSDEVIGITGQTPAGPRTRVATYWNRPLVNSRVPSRGSTQTHTCDLTTV